MYHLSQHSRKDRNKNQESKVRNSLLPKRRGTEPKTVTRTHTTNSTPQNHSNWPFNAERNKRSHRIIMGTKKSPAFAFKVESSEDFTFDEVGRAPEAPNIFEVSGKGFIDYYKSGRFSDVIFVLPNGKELYVHKLILAKSSPLLHDLFLKEEKKNQKSSFCQSGKEEC